MQFLVKDNGLRWYMLIPVLVKDNGLSSSWSRFYLTDFATGIPVYVRAVCQCHWYSALVYLQCVCVGWGWGVRVCVCERERMCVCLCVCACVRRVWCLCLHCQSFRNRTLTTVKITGLCLDNGVGDILWNCATHAFHAAVVITQHTVRNENLVWYSSHSSHTDEQTLYIAISSPAADALSHHFDTLSYTQTH